MRTDNFDKIGKEENLLDRVEQVERSGRSTVRRNVRSARVSNLANELGALDYRVVDASGNLRMVMSAYDLFEEIGVHAHFAGLDTNQDVTFYISADDGKAYFASGAGIFDVDGLHMRAEAFPSSNVIDWVADDDGLVVGSLLGWYVNNVASGLYLLGKGRDVDHYGVAGLAAMGYDDDIGEYKVLFDIDTRGDAVLDLRNATRTSVGEQYLTIITQTSDTSAMNIIFNLQTYSSGTVANGLGTGMAYWIEDSAGNQDVAGHHGVYWVDKTSTSEDAAFILSLMKAGSITTSLIVDPTAGVTMPFGATIATGGLNSTGNIDTNNSNLRANSTAINDDAATSFTPSRSTGICKVEVGGDTTVYAVFHYNTATPAVTVHQAGSNTNSTTGALTGTTGTDTKFTVSAHTDGKLYFENRRGGSRTIFVSLV